ncbi:MAG TPA: alpha/beta hydrolase [Bosea sp. (in: a-proteobacteria)]|jgi:esterase/lipase superfamily enzyme|uniref:alpha/beta hydrolase n=1 Tax=Bosea sp. (in: a-proteobacteria) TaxID=1871050 RepID=UPI002E140C88|nr:alpha/beta hydrolase [Bosea sp. (in: a-proteobacteria)]
MRSALATVMALLLAACGSTPSGLLQPVGPIAGTDKVNMLTATTRAASQEPGVLYSGDRGRGVSFSNIVVSIPPGREAGTIQLPRTAPGNPATDFTVSSARALSRAELPGWFASTGGRKRRAFVFVHGFNTQFDRAVFRFAQLAHDADANAAPVLFSWPSRGHLFDYRLDLDNASFSRTDLADLLLMAANSPAVGEVVVLAHSMGAWVAVEALKQVALKKGGVPPKINNLILASPDLDIDVFRRQVEEMGPRRPQITIFASQNDRALQLSQFLARGATRLGAIDLSREQYQAQLGGLAGITVIDMSDVRASDRINHDTYASSPEIVRLIGDRLLQGQVITDSDVTGTSTAVETLGSAAGLLITAPIRVFDAATTR